jgi:hypothetical protein
LPFDQIALPGIMEYIKTRKEHFGVINSGGSPIISGKNLGAGGLKNGSLTIACENLDFGVSASGKRESSLQRNTDSGKTADSGNFPPQYSMGKSKFEDKGSGESLGVGRTSGTSKGISDIDNLNFDLAGYWRQLNNYTSNRNKMFMNNFEEYKARK